jgi:NADH dehydrogenase (ubiquinone) 1 alpha subcomplex subunit 9
MDRVLSSHALAALAEFNAEKDAHEQKFERLKADAEAHAAASAGLLSMDAFTEDWNESQFWVCFHARQPVEGQQLEGAEC